jgi:hypothetical protein
MMMNITKKRWKKAVLILIGIVLLLAGFVAFVLPGIVKSQAVRIVEAATGRTLGIGGISINPFTWTVVIRDFRISETGSGVTFTSFSSARITVNPETISKRVPIIAAAHFTSPHFRIVRVGENLYNFTDLLKWLPLHPRLSVHNLTMTHGSVDFIDRALPVEMRHELRKVEFSVPFITTMSLYADRYVTPRLSAVVNGSPISAEGKLRPFPRAVEGTADIELNDVSIPFYHAYFPVSFPIRVKSGTVSAHVAINYRAAQKEKPELTLSGTVTLANTKLDDRTGAPFLSVTRLEAEITRALLLTGDFDLSSLAADGLEVFLTRDKKGVLSHSRFVAKAVPGAPPRRKVIATVTESRLRNGRFHYIDNVPPGGFKADLKEVTMDLHDYSTAPGKRASYALSFTTAHGEKAHLKGEFSPRPLATSSSIELSGADLKSYSPYFPKGLNVVVADGKIDGRLTISMAARRGGLTGRFGGTLGIRSLVCLDADGEELLKWKGLRLNSMKGVIAPFALDIGEVALTRLYARTVIEKDARLNLQNLYSRESEVDMVNTVSGKKRSSIRIGAVTMQDGTIDFTDNHVSGGYNTTLFNLGGRISDLSSDENRFAGVDLRGNLENRSPLRISGQINPLRNDLYADLKISFTDIDLIPMTPYSGTYLGYAVDKGKLFINSRYRIENRKLDLENRVVIDQLTLGRRIESDKAISLSVRLAVALLKDRKGEINLDLPVTGRTDAPLFHLWHMARQVLKNIFDVGSKSPFDQLRSLVGVNEDLSSVGFASGSAALSTSEREKLLKLAAALNERPALKISIAGFVDRERDDTGNRSEIVLRSLAVARAAEVTTFLVTQGKIDSVRIIQNNGDMYRVSEKGAGFGSRVEFEVAAE